MSCNTLNAKKLHKSVQFFNDIYEIFIYSQTIGNLPEPTKDNVEKLTQYSPIHTILQSLAVPKVPQFRWMLYLSPQARGFRFSDNRHGGQIREPRRTLLLPARPGGRTASLISRKAHRGRSLPPLCTKASDSDP